MEIEKVSAEIDLSRAGGIDMVGIMTEVLSLDAEQLTRGREERAGKSAARAIGETLAAASMDGDIKAAAMLMELAGLDFRSRDSLEKHEIDRQKLGMGKQAGESLVIEEIRPVG